jgi:hypothetical protein
VYVNGELADTLDCLGELETNDEDLYIGSRAGAERWLLGVVDELYVFDVALTEKQVEHLFGGAGHNRVAATLWHSIKNGLRNSPAVAGN